MNGSEFAASYDESIRSPRMSALYGDTGYFNVGYWDDDCDHLAGACDHMVDMVAASIPSGARIILDAGCGVGAGTARLAASFPDALVIAGNISHWQLGEARGRGAAAPVVMDAARLPLASGSVDAVVAIESPQHFDSRDCFLAEAFRVLRPGGTITLADMMFQDRVPVGAWMLPDANRIVTPAAYAERLSAAGFAAVEVRDVTDRTWRPFCAAMLDVFQGFEQQVRAYEKSLACYVLATALKG